MKPSELLSDASKWTKGCSARRADGAQTIACKSDAVCWCIHGAMSNCEAWESGFDGRRRLLEKVIIRLFPERVESIKKLEDKDGTFFHVAFNDHPETTFEDVRKVLLAAGL